MRLDWLPTVLRGAGLHVIELHGWLERQSRPGFDPVGVVWHHTATGPSWPDASVAALLRDGRSDLSGPLSQLGLQRDGTFVVVAAGRANHNGYGMWGNDSIGIEAYNDGRGEPWPDVQLDAYKRGTAAICRRMGWNPSTAVLGHRETDPGRKIDPTGIDMNAARSAVSFLLRSPSKERALMALSDSQQQRLADNVQLLVDRLGTLSTLDDKPLGTRSVVERRVSLTYKAVGGIAARLGALESAVAQLGAGGDVDYVKVQAAAEAALRRVLGAVDDN